MAGSVWWLILKLAFYKGKKRLSDRLIQFWTRSPYSHVELVLTHGEVSECASSSLVDGGVRVKHIRLHPDNWDVVDLPPYYSLTEARQWFRRHSGEKYDFLGLLGFVIPIKHHVRRWFCSEAIAAALDIADPWRFSPADLAAIFETEKVS